MLKKLTILLFSLFLIAFNANAGSDGELALKKINLKLKIQKIVLKS